MKTHIVITSLSTVCLMSIMGPLIGALVAIGIFFVANCLEWIHKYCRNEFEVKTCQCWDFYHARLMDTLDELSPGLIGYIVLIILQWCWSN